MVPADFRITDAGNIRKRASSPKTRGPFENLLTVGAKRRTITVLAEMI